MAARDHGSQREAVWSHDDAMPPGHVLRRVPISVSRPAPRGIMFTRTHSLWLLSRIITLSVLAAGCADKPADLQEDDLSVDAPIDSVRDDLETPDFLDPDEQSSRTDSTSDFSSDIIDEGGPDGAREDRAQDDPSEDSGSGDSRVDIPADLAVDEGSDISSACTYRSVEAVSDAPLPGEETAGRSIATTRDGFTDDYLYDSTDYIKVGVRREWGGTIVFFGLADDEEGLNSTNTIDANDTGREVQVAFYDPDRAMQNCAHNASCRTTATECEHSIRYLGWNPVQGGNRCNNGSGVESVVNENGVLEVNTLPLHWNPNWDDATCISNGCDSSATDHRRADVRVRQSLRFVRRHVVELRYTVENLVDMDHAPTNQEMPTMYTGNGEGGPDLWRLFDAGGNQITIDEPGNDGFFYENFDSPAPWVTLQNDAANYGVGLLYENGLTTFQGWQKRSLPFNNVRARFTFGIPANGTVHARAYLILGSFTSVQNEANWLLEHTPPFGVMDEPNGTISGTGATTIRGWALDNRGVSAVEAHIDASVVVPLTYGGSRPDVCIAWPGYPGCDGVGYSGSHDFGAPSECPHLVEIVARDGDDNERIIARRLVTVAP